MIIAENEFYLIKINIEKNRIYLRLCGFWKSLEQVPNYLADIQKALETLDEIELMILFDLTKFEIPSPEINHLLIEAQKLLINSGLKYCAEVTPTSAVTMMIIDDYSRKSSMNKRSFNNYADAEKWLDQKL